MSDLETLAIELATAKRKEDEAKNLRIELEEKIAELVETPENGSRTVEAGPGLKVTVKRGISYKADVEKIRALDLEGIPVKLKPAEWEFNTKEYERLREENVELARLVGQHVVVKPRKTSVSIKVC